MYHLLAPQNRSGGAARTFLGPAPAELRHRRIPLTRLANFPIPPSTPRRKSPHNPLSIFRPSRSPGRCPILIRDSQHRQMALPLEENTAPSQPGQVLRVPSFRSKLKIHS